MIAPRLRRRLGRDVEAWTMDEWRVAVAIILRDATQRAAYRVVPKPEHMLAALQRSVGARKLRMSSISFRILAGLYCQRFRGRRARLAEISREHDWRDALARAAS